MKKIKNILILAGGDGTRFWPLTNKSYFQFLGKPLLSHLLKSVKQFTENIIIVVNPSDVQLINRLNLANETTTVEQNLNLSGQAGAILSAKDYVKGEVLILNAEDIISPKLLYRYIDITISNSFGYVLTAFKVKNYFPGGYLKFRNSNVEEIVEKPDPDKVPSDMIKLVVDYFKDFAQFCEILEKTKTDKDNSYEQAINNLLKQNIKVDFINYDDYWQVLKYPWHALPMMHHFLKTLSHEVKLGKNVKIAKTAKIVGPCFIEDNTIIGDFAMIRQSHVGKNCLIGGYSEVTRSYLSDGVSLHRNYIGDSVLDKNVLFGAQAATANFRFDSKSIKSKADEKKIDTNFAKLGAIIGANSKIGVNTTVLPGVKIGKNSFIGPGEIVYEDIGNNKFMLKGRLTKNIA